MLDKVLGVIFFLHLYLCIYYFFLCMNYIFHPGSVCLSGMDTIRRVDILRRKQEEKSGLLHVTFRHQGSQVLQEERGFISKIRKWSKLRPRHIKRKVLNFRLERELKRKE